MHGARFAACIFWSWSLYILMHEEETHRGSLRLCFPSRLIRFRERASISVLGIAFLSKPFADAMPGKLTFLDSQLHCLTDGLLHGSKGVRLARHGSDVR